jgi:hypothetical protein
MSPMISKARSRISCVTMRTISGETKNRGGTRKSHTGFAASQQLLGIGRHNLTNIHQHVIWHNESVKRNQLASTKGNRGALDVGTYWVDSSCCLAKLSRH